MANVDDPERRAAAAKKIQGAWKNRKGSILDAESRWADAQVHAELRSSRLAADQGKNDPKSRWRRTAFLATRLRDDNRMINAKDTDKGSGTISKSLETQHWLELTDGKHRTIIKRGSNRIPQIISLDGWIEVAGKTFHIPNVPEINWKRRYLSPEQRLNYLVEIDEKGLLRWSHNHTLIDTSPGKWKDSGDGTGIVPLTSSADERPKLEPERRISFSVSPSTAQRIATGPCDDPFASKHASATGKRSFVRRWWKRRSLSQPLRKQLFRNMISKDTWIYVADGHYNLYIGIKDTGTFQHSSFLSGGVVASAGLISVHEGLIHKLSPLSGHYRTKIENFREFLRALSEKGVDMHRVEKRRAVVSLWGIQQINKGKNFKKRSKGKIKAIVKHLARHRRRHRDQHDADASHDMHVSLTQWKRDILQGRKRLVEPVAGATEQRS